MKKLLTSLLLLSVVFISCGPNAEEKAKVQKAHDDSVMVAQKAHDDSVAKSSEQLLLSKQADEKRKQDSLGAVQKAIQDSIASQVSKQEQIENLKKQLSDSRTNLRIAKEKL